jgi:outer membrane lipoprotein SlyB
MPAWADVIMTLSQPFKHGFSAARMQRLAKRVSCFHRHLEKTIMMKRLTLLALAAVLAGCSTPPESGNVYNGAQTMNEQTIRMGTVESVRNVTIAHPESGVGAMSGVALGGLGGSQIGNGNGSAAVGILGAIAGGLIGERVENRANMKPGLEITVRLENGEMRAVTQLADEMFRPGERVRLLSNGYTTRITH